VLAIKTKLATIRERIVATPLNDVVIENLEKFMDTLNGSPVAVRSSGSAEDLSGESFAGQYDTFLNKRTISEVCDAVKACWASMFKPQNLDYAFKPVFLSKEVKNDLEASVFNPMDFKPPKMGVLIMKMVEARASGVVCFTRNI
jgi:phosphoenolpyruvate synthase/pyruvate phosphate dikinase